MVPFAPAAPGSNKAFETVLRNHPRRSLNRGPQYRVIADTTPPDYRIVGDRVHAEYDVLT
ncbi:hypothetical protein I551_6612 [Mycobacterium ulcerans str. Harvey]|uniref:Uncharacterized protein n=1 Tax=Mycobacterium ulcerans str. Harvey TaxID=1299332 RepID=A0ABP3A7T8_MYCUL|nr:hypothetical protein I551_6612 [Mycobacterium ulcerans str. Harvey]